MKNSFETRGAPVHLRHRTIGCLVLLGCCLLCSCDSNPGTEQPVTISLLSTHQLGVGEPSGLAVNEAGTVLWTVGTRPNRIYCLDAAGTITDTLAYKGNDLEGIAYDPSDASLWVVEERNRVIVHLDLKGDVLATRTLDLPGDDNSGLEGISLDAMGQLYVLNEKEPGLFIMLNTDLSIDHQVALQFAPDFSGLAYDSKRMGFWVLSDQAEALFFWTEQAGLVEKHTLPFAKAEGVAINTNANRLYIVSESSQTLYVYRFGNISGTKIQ